MKQYIDAIKESLSTMMVVRGEYLANQEVFNLNPDYQTAQRIFDIYTVDAPFVLIEMIKKLKLAEDEISDEGIFVNNVFFYFGRVENEPRILKAFYDNYENEHVAPCIEKIIGLAAETQSCLEKLQSVS